MTSPLPQGDQKVHAVRTMFDTIAPRYELVNRFISLGLDRRWRRLAVKELQLQDASTVLDLATGTGDFCRLLQARGHFPIGVDLSFGMLAHAHTSAPLVQGDALNLPFAGASVDAVTSGFALRNFVELPAFFTELARVVRPGGRIALLDAAQPQNRVIRLGHGFYFGRVVPKMGALFSDPAAYRYLPESLSYLPPSNELVSLLEAAGFTDISHTTLTFGAAQLITATHG